MTSYDTNKTKFGIEIETCVCFLDTKKSIKDPGELYKSKILDCCNCNIEYVSIYQDKKKKVFYTIFGIKINIILL